MKQEEFKLIDNHYNSSEAREVLSSLITDKIKFLNVCILRHHEHYAERATKLEKRTDELRQTLNRINELLLDAEAKGLEVDIRSNISLTFSEKKQTLSEASRS